MDQLDSELNRLQNTITDFANIRLVDASQIADVQTVITNFRDAYGDLESLTSIGSKLNDTFKNISIDDWDTGIEKLRE